MRFYEGSPTLEGEGEFVLENHCRFSGAHVPALLSTTADARIVVGRLAGVAHAVELIAAEEISIGENSLLGPYVAIYDSSLHQLEEDDPVKQAPVRIGKNVWVGHGATILNGVTIGDQAVIGAGAVISRDVPPRTLVAGNPAKPIRELRVSDDWLRP